VILLPDGGNYAGVLGANGTQRLKEWVRNGGTLVAMAGALNFLADERTGLLATTVESDVKPEQKKEDPAAGKVLNTEADLRRAIEPGKEDPAAVAGALLRLKMDPDHWLSAGITDQLYAMVSGSDIYAPLKLDRGVNAVYFAGPDELLASGFLWESSRKQLAFKPFVMVQREGRGQVIGFTADPNFRGMVEGLHPLFLSAVFRGPAHVQ
jgi:hypothetical protein